MADTPSTPTEDVREILLNALEVEMATLKAAVGFWRQWTEYVADYVKTTGSSLRTIRNSNADMRQVLLEAVDASRRTARLMTELPRKAAQDFLRELEALEAGKASPRKGPAKRRARAKP
jgi:hypothetical protein